MARFNQIEKVIRDHKKYSMLKKFFATMACLVVFVTTYMLILPALTLETELICNTEEHAHSDSCYTTSKNLVCGQDEYEGHSHSSDCYTTTKTLVCGEEESEEHQHSDSCYQESTELTCNLEERSGHSHSDSCYEEYSELTCNKEEHEHEKSCYRTKEKEVTDFELKAKTKDGITVIVSGKSDIFSVDMSDVTFELKGIPESDDAEDLIKKDLGDDSELLNQIYHFQILFKNGGDEIIPNGKVLVTFQGIELNKNRNFVIYNYRVKDKESKIVDMKAKVKDNGDLNFDTDNLAIKDTYCEYEVVTFKDVEEVAEEATTEEIAEEATTEEVAEEATSEEVAEESTTEEVSEETTTEEVAEETTTEKVAEEATTEEVAEESTTEEAAKEEATEFKLQAKTPEGFTVTLKAMSNVLPCDPEEVELKVIEIKNSAALDMIEKALDVKDGEEYTTYLYDITLEHEGQEIEPDGEVTVKFYNLEVADESEVKIFHIPDNAKKAEDVGATVNDNGTVRFETDSFSIYGVSLLNSADNTEEDSSTDATDDTEVAEDIPMNESADVPMTLADNAVGTPSDMTNYLTGLSISKDNNGSWQQSTEFHEGDRIRVDMTFNIPATVVTTDSPSIYYTFPAGLLPAGTHMDGKVYDNGTRVGTYCIETDDFGVSTITLTYDDFFADGNSFTGTAFFTAEAALGAGQSEVEYDFAGTNTHITVKGKETTADYDVSTQKTASLSSDGKTIDYVITVSTSKGTDGQVNIYDKVYKDYLGENPAGATYSGNATVEKYNTSGTLDSSGNTSKTISGSEFSFDLPELAAGESYKIRYSINVNENAAADDGSLSINNYASAAPKLHPYSGQSAYTNTEVSGSKISKYGSYNQNTGKIEWTITVYNPTNRDLNGQQIEDTLGTQGITLSGTPVVKDGSNNTISGGNFDTSGDKLFTYTFPSGSTASTYYIKYNTTAPDADNTSVSNTATYKGENGGRDYSASSNPSVQHRSFGLTKSTRNTWLDSNGTDKFEWQTYITVPDGNFPQDGYFYEDTLQDAKQNDNTIGNTHYGTRSEIENKIQNTFVLNVLENGETTQKNWSTASSEYVDIDIKYYTAKGGTEVTSDNEEVKYFTVSVKPKSGKTFSASNFYFNYITSGRRTGFTDGKYYFGNDGAVGDIHSTPSQTVDLGQLDLSKTRYSVSNDTEGEMVEWSAYINLPESTMSSDGYLYEDIMVGATDTSGTTYSGTHYGTISEIQSKIQDTFRLKVDGQEQNWNTSTSTYVDVEIKYYKDVDGQHVETNSDADKVTYFTVKVSPKTGQNVIADYFKFNYPTRINQEGANGGYFTYKNKGIVGTHEKEASYAKRVMNSLEKSVYTGNAGSWDYTVADYTNANGKYIYSNKNGTEVDYQDGIITYRVVVKTGLGAANDKAITITDTLPEGLEYVEGSAKAAGIIFYNMEYETFSTAQSGAEMSAFQMGWVQNPEDIYRFADHLHTSVNGNTLTMALDAGYASKENYINTFNYANAGYIGFYYQVRITDPAWNDVKVTTKSYVNEVTWEQGGIGTSQDTKIVRPVEEVDKLATPVTDDEGNVTAINYNVVVNPTAQDLDPDANVLQLYDTLNPGNGTATMQLESIKLYEYSSTASDHVGAAINTSRYQYHYDNSTKKLSLIIPDELACILQYTYTVSSGNSSRDYTISNKVSLMGKEYDSNAVDMKAQDSGATSQKSTIVLYKVDKDNYGKHLSGVGFELKWMDRDDHWVVNQNEDYYYTNDNGQIVFDNDTSEAIYMRQNMLYRLIEKVNPNTGYVVDSTPYYLVWLDGSTSADDWYANNLEGRTFYHGSISKDQIHFFEHEGASIYIENEYKEIAVKKVWVDSDGTDIQNPSGNVTVQLSKTTTTPSGKKLKFGDNTYWIADNSTVTIVTPGIWRTTSTAGEIYGVDSQYVTVSTERPDPNQNQYIDTYVIDSLGLADECEITIQNVYTPQCTIDYVKGETITNDPIGDPITLNAANNWSYSWGRELLESDVTYSVTETMINGQPIDPTQYEVIYSNNGIETGEVVITNKISAERVLPDDVLSDIEVEKKWYDEEGNEITGEALNGKTAEFVIKQVADPESDHSVTVDYGTFTLPNENGEWTITIPNLPITSYTSETDATTYKYYFVENEVDGYTPTYRKDGIINGIIAAINPEEDPTGAMTDQGKVIISNTMDETTSVSARKVWSDGNTNQSVTVGLNRNSEPYGNAITLDSSNNWYYQWDNLPKYDGDGNEYRYTITEDAVSGYTSSITKDQAYVKLPYGTKLANGYTYVFTEQGNTNALTGTSGNKNISWNNVGDLTSTNVAIDNYSQWTADQNGEAWSLHNTRYFRADSSHIYSTSSDNKSVNVLAMADGYSFYDGSHYFTGVIGDGTSTGNADITNAKLMDAYLYIGTNDSSLLQADANYVLTNIKQDTPDVPSLNSTVTVYKKWYKNLDGEVIGISRSGSIKFNIYRVAIPDGTDPDTDPDTPEHTHDWGEGVVTKNPTETEEGVRTYTCSCGDTKTEAIPKLTHTHNYSGRVTQEATCYTKAIMTYTCSGCNERYTQETGEFNPENHSGGTYLVGEKAATATEDGYTGDVYCNGCKVKIEDGEVISKTGGDTPSTEKATVRMMTWGGAQATLSVDKNATIRFTAKFTGNGWFPTLTASANGTTFTVTESDVENNIKYYYFTAYVSGDMDIDITCDVAHELEWSAETVTSARTMAKAASARTTVRTMSALSTNDSEVVTIPDGAVKLNDEPIQIHSDNNWTWTGVYDAQEGYTYKYYVEEIDTENNWTVDYEGQGSTSLTINNTITERTFSLPHTGGMGTTPFTISGLALIGLAGGGIMIKKKRRKEEI